MSAAESKDVDMIAYVRAAEALQQAFGCSVIVVHHSGIDKSRPWGILAERRPCQRSIQRVDDDNVGCFRVFSDCTDQSLMLFHWVKRVADEVDIRRLLVLG